MMFDLDKRVKYSGIEPFLEAGECMYYDMKQGMRGGSMGGKFRSNSWVEGRMGP